jgi:hypothetical protein
MYKDNLDDSTYARSVAFGEKMLVKRYIGPAPFDNYPQTRGKPRFLGSENNGKWRPTAPDYLDGVEFCWGTMETFAVKSSSDFACHHHTFSNDKNSEYFKQNSSLRAKQKQYTPSRLPLPSFGMITLLLYSITGT